MLLLDEPAAGLSPEETRNMVALVRGLKGRYTIVLIEHKIDIIMSVSDRISVMHFGSLIAEGSPEEIQRNPDVRRAYLGGIAGMISSSTRSTPTTASGHILHDLSLSVGESEVVALLGRNGAGKTTTMRSIAGLTPPRSGAIRYKGRDIAGLEAHRDLAPGHRAGPRDARHLFVSNRPRKPVHRRPSRARAGRWTTSWNASRA